MYNEKKIVVVVPALNEEASIEEVLDGIPSYVDEIVVVDDGSTDRTAAIALNNGAQVISHKRNKGLGMALQSGIGRALELGADVMVNIDADGQFNPRDMAHLIKPIVEEQFDFVTASRFKDKELTPEIPKIKLWGNRMVSRMVSWIIGQTFHDVSCGYRAYSRDVLLKLNLFGYFTYTQETFIDLAFKNIAIGEIPLKIRGTRQHGESKIASNLFRYGYNTFKIMFRAFRDYRPLKLFLLATIMMLICGLGSGGFLLGHYLTTGNFSPHKWAGFVSGFFLVLSLLFFIVGIILDMFVRMRRNQEEMLYLLRKSNYNEPTNRTERN
jgi:glycosyltransferase involved in cell wall biosynthesis